MTRLLSLLRWEVVVQQRQGFYYVSAFVLLLLVALLRPLARTEGIPLARIAPGFLLMLPLITTFYFVGALVLLEKGEGTLAGLIVTPLRPAEYLAVKVLSLGSLAVAECLLLLILTYGVRVAVGPLLAGLVLAATFYTLAGFVVIVRYQSINEYLLPSIAVVTLFCLPLLGWVGWWQGPLRWLHPLQPALVLLQAAFAPVPAPLLAAATLLGLGWAGGSGWLAHRAFYRFVIRAA